MDNATLGILTKQDIVALQSAETITFRHQGTGENQVGIDVTFFVKKGKQRFETSHFIKCESKIANHAGFNSPDDLKRKVYRYAVESFLHINRQYDLALTTATEFLKEGDKVSIKWDADYCRNGYVNDSRLQGKETGYAGEMIHADALHLIVERKGKRFVFLLKVGICPDNSARMIRESRGY